MGAMPCQEAGLPAGGGHEAKGSRPWGAPTAYGHLFRQSEVARPHPPLRGTFSALHTLRAPGEKGTAPYFFFGAIIITIWRPSRRGRDSITISSPSSVSMRVAISRPSS